MKCVICKGSDVQLEDVDEEIRTGNDIVLLPIKVLVCRSCGERYYDSKTMRKLEQMKEKLSRSDLEVEEVGKIFRTQAT